MKRIREERGFTLIELMVTLALVGLVIAGGFSLYFFADRSYVTGTISADIQADVQIAMKRITEELRLAHHLEFVDQIPERNALEKDDHYLFTQDGVVVLRTQLSDQVLTGVNLELADYVLEFDRSRNQTGDPLEDALWIRLSSQNPRVQYSLQSDIQVLNLRLSGIEGNGPADAVYFTKNLSEVEREEARIVRRRCFLGRVVFDPDAAELLVLRTFRDKELSSNRVGRMVIDFYYAISPTIANFLDAQPLARITTRFAVRGIVTVISRLT